MGVYKTRAFAKFARKANVGSVELLAAASAVMSGHADADLRGGVYKQRVAREAGGKSGGFRTLILFKVGGHCFFVYGFAKNQKANITTRERVALKLLAATYLQLDSEALQKAETAGEIQEVRIDNEDRADS